MQKSRKTWRTKSTKTSKINNEKSTETETIERKKLPKNLKGIKKRVKLNYEKNRQKMAKINKNFLKKTGNKKITKIKKVAKYWSPIGNLRKLIKKN